MFRLPLFAAALGVVTLLTPSSAFVPFAIRGTASAPALRIPSSSAQVLPKIATIARKNIIAPRCQVIFNSNEDWKPDHHQEESGNTDVGDYFPDGDTAGSASDPNAGVGFSSGAAAGSTGGGAENRLGDLLSSKGAEVRTVERQTYTDVKFEAHPWRIDGDFASGDPRYDLTFNTATNIAETEVMVEPNSMTFEDYVAGWTADSDPNWEVTPTEGTLDRRGGAESFFDVRWNGSAVMKGEHFGTLVIVLPNDQFSYTYKFRVTVA